MSAERPMQAQAISNFDDRAEQRAMLRDSVVRFARDGNHVIRMRRLRNTTPGFERKVWCQMAALGWLGVLVPERYGGLALGFSEMAIVLEQLARVLVSEPLSASAVLAGRAIVHSENERLKAELLSGLAAGELIPALAWQEKTGVIDPSAIATTATAFESTLCLSGTKRFVQGAAGADGFVISARSCEGIVLCWIKSGAEGVNVESQLLADGRLISTLELRDVVVSAENILAVGPTALAALERAVDEATIMIGAELCGVMSRALEISLEYMKTRVQFGKPIGSFQALQHRVVDLYLQKELSVAALNDAVKLIDQDPDHLERAAIASRVKARCSEAAMRITREAIQLHGAIGFTDEYDVGLYMKRALVLSAWLGNAALHRRRYASLTMT